MKYLPKHTHKIYKNASSTLFVFNIQKKNDKKSNKNLVKLNYYFPLFIFSFSVLGL